MIKNGQISFIKLLFLFCFISDLNQVFFKTNNRAYAASNNLESKVEDVLSKFKRIFDPLLVQAGYGSLIFDLKREDDMVDIYATRDRAKNSVIVIKGGIFDHPSMTPKILTLLICHEIGHFLGGAPKIRANSWSSVEGQADFFVTRICMPKMREEKDSSHEKDEEEIGEIHPWCLMHESPRTCQMGLNDSKELVEFLKKIKHSSENVDIDSPISNEVDRIQINHPSLQCRLDTLVSGVFCNVSPEVPFHSSNVVTGSCESLNAGVPIPFRFRPLCWFKEN